MGNTSCPCQWNKVSLYPIWVRKYRSKEVMSIYMHTKTFLKCPLQQHNLPCVKWYTRCYYTVSVSMRENSIISVCCTSCQQRLEHDDIACDPSFKARYHKHLENQNTSDRYNGCQISGTARNENTCYMHIARQCKHANTFLSQNWCTVCQVSVMYLNWLFNLWVRAA
jgi:hypothetical protein